MGKCLSCCRSSSPTAECTSNHDKFSEVHPNNEIIRHPPDSGGDPYRRSLDNNLANASSMRNSDPVTAKSSTVEKKMFYQRIPPLLSSTSDSKRSSHPSRDVSESKINHLFEQYKDPMENAILTEGIEQFCNDLNIRPEEFRTLLLAWKFNAQQMCCFTRDEFVEGCRSIRVDSIQSIQVRLPELIKEIQELEKFKMFYRFTFKFGLEGGQRVLVSDVAIQLWKLVFFCNEPPILKRWLMFLEKHPNVRTISKDTWNMFLNFSDAVGDDLSSYDDTEAWPSLFDDFVEYENDQTNQNIVPNKEVCILEQTS